MRRIDPEAYPESERPPDACREEAALSQALRSGLPRRVLRKAALWTINVDDELETP